MILYHGSYIEVENPEIITSIHGRDFGFGFYLTPIKEQAEKWARRKALFYKTKTPIVSVFEWNEDISSLTYKNFKDQDMEWLDLVIKCRSDIKYHHGYDVVEGKIADDDVGETIDFVIEGIMRKEDALERLKYQKANYQIAFCSQKALLTLRFLNSYEVK